MKSVMSGCDSELRLMRLRPRLRRGVKRPKNWKRKKTKVDGSQSVTGRVYKKTTSK